MTRFVPYLSEAHIENDSALLLAEYAQARGVTIAPPIPIEDIIEKYLKLRIEFDDMHARHNVPRRTNGSPDILGAIYGDGSIFIDESLDPEEHPSREGRYRFTLAHERACTMMRLPRITSLSGLSLRRIPRWRMVCEG